MPGKNSNASRRDPTGRGGVAKAAEPHESQSQREKAPIYGKLQNISIGPKFSYFYIPIML